jgi:hypothetical protein
MNESTAGSSQTSGFTTGVRGGVVRGGRRSGETVRTFPGRPPNSAGPRLFRPSSLKNSTSDGRRLKQVLPIFDSAGREPGDLLEWNDGDDRRPDRSVGQLCSPRILWCTDGFKLSFRCSGKTEDNAEVSSNSTTCRSADVHCKSQGRLTVWQSQFSTDSPTACSRV